MKPFGIGWHYGFDGFFLVEYQVNAVLHTIEIVLINVVAAVVLDASKF